MKEQTNKQTNKQTDKQTNKYNYYLTKALVSLKF